MQMTHRRIGSLGRVAQLGLCLLGLVFVGNRPLRGQGIEDMVSPDRLAAIEKAFGDPPGMVRLVREGRVWVDRGRRRVIVDGYVALRQGPLEMFACPARTKEHESVVAVVAQAQHVHAGLLAVGGKVGRPVQFEPYRPATGQTVHIFVLWWDAEGNKQVANAKHWVRQANTGDTLSHDWVFAGSQLYVDPDSGQSQYLADAGDMICVANFPTAMLDLGIRSAAENVDLMFVANTERIPPEGTPIRLILQLGGTD